MQIGRSFILHRDQLGPDADPYMIRFKIIDTPLFAIRIHRILRSDQDRDLHDHPWSFLSVVLRGGYIEEIPASLTRPVFTPHGDELSNARMIAAPAIVAHRAEDRHRLTLTRPATTLVFCGPRRRGWGFQTEGGWIPWRKYLESGDAA